VIRLKSTNAWPDIANQIRTLAPWLTTLDNETVIQQLAVWLLSHYATLPEWDSHRWVIVPKFLVDLVNPEPITVKWSQCVGTAWLFESKGRWPNDYSDWIRLAKIMYQGIQGEDVWRKFLSSTPIYVYELANQQYWIADGCRRIYTARLFGYDGIPAWCVARMNV